jgi:hypothetical protein
MSRKFKPANRELNLITAAALLLPGLLPAQANATDEDSVDFQYSHYQEGKRTNLNGYQYNAISSQPNKYAIPNRNNPIEVDSLHGSGKITLTDRVKFAFNYIEDTWGGATPMYSAPEQSGALGYNWDYYDDKGEPVLSGASPLAAGSLNLDKQGHLVYPFYDSLTGQSKLLKDRIVHVMSMASQETRQQGDFTLSYDWDDASVSVGGGISTEPDYESRFVNLGGRMDFNQKQTTLDIGLSYTNSDIDAHIDPQVDDYFSWTNRYRDNITFNKGTGLHEVKGIRQDWTTRLNLTQVVNKDAVLKLGVAFTRSTGYLGNPYKYSAIYVPSTTPNYLGWIETGGAVLLEQRPEARNLWSWQTGWVQYVEPLDAALHFDYSFAHDDWGIHAHTFEADWVQPVGSGWTITPRIRYYSQSAANFYSPYFYGNGETQNMNPDPANPDYPNIKMIKPPENFSSDQRLSGFGTLSGGVTVAKEFAKGIRLETGFEYYSHQGSLKLGGGGEDSFADYDYWVANAALKVDFSALGRATTEGRGGHHHAHTNIPAGVMFGHTLGKAGDMMAGYRYLHGWQAGSFLNGNHTVNQDQVIAKGCPNNTNNPYDPLANGCSMLPREMTMNMHMLDLMYAPTDWLTLMLMPQFVNMQMHDSHPNVEVGSSGHHGGVAAHEQQTGGVGDTGMYALVKLFDHPNHHIHASLGFTAPTGDVQILEASVQNRKSTQYVHHGMQLGSGTWDFKPSLTYTGKADAWLWGAQVIGTKRLESKNDAGYALGDMFESSVWGGYDITNWLTGTFRVNYAWQGRMQGEYPAPRSLDEVKISTCPKYQFTTWAQHDPYGNPIGAGVLDNTAYQACLNSDALKSNLKANKPNQFSPMDNPANYGGLYVDVGFGLSATVPTGAFAGNSLAFEWLQPVYTNVNGYQLDRDGALSFTWSYGF